MEFKKGDIVRFTQEFLAKHPQVLTLRYYRNNGPFIVVRSRSDDGVDIQRLDDDHFMQGRLAAAFELDHFYMAVKKAKEEHERRTKV